jgi:DeoR/GlpR family transcriptional regulator of sugar metabolism
MIEQAAEATLLLDRSKLSARGLNAIAPLADLDAVVAHGISESELATLRATGLAVREAVR